MIVGVVLSLFLAILSFVRISPSGVGYRSPALWSNQATLVLTQAGAPELRSVLPPAAGGYNSPLADTGRFAGLIDVYAAMATSDPVMRVLERQGLVDEADMQNGEPPITAAAVVSTVGGGSTPMMTISASSDSGRKATDLTRAATGAFVRYVRDRQAAAKIPINDRIQLRVVQSAEEPTLVKPRSKALPILVLLGGLIATLAVVFTRDNLARGVTAPALTTIGSRKEIVEPDASTGASHGRSTLEPVPEPAAPDEAAHATQAGSAAAGNGTAVSSEVAHGRWAARQGRAPSS